MKFLIVGLGSMGKRRVRCLQSLGHTEIHGLDLREDRRAEASEKYGITTFADADEAFTSATPDAVIISLPPDLHHIYMERAASAGIPFFVEAGVLNTNREKISQLCRENNSAGIPSLTLGFHPAIQIIARLVKDGELGTISNVLYHCGSYLPDWHTYEHVSDYYVSNPATGGCREIVAFELSWIAHVLGFPKKVCGHARKTIHIEGAEEIEDTYNILLDYESYLASITVDVASRAASRRLTINGSKTQLVWDWDEPCVKVFEPNSKTWNVIEHETPKAHQGYNVNIGEQMYIDELQAFIECVNDAKPFPNSLEEDDSVLRLVYAIEEADKASQYVTFIP